MQINLEKCRHCLLVVFSCAFLFACKQPTTQLPNYDPAEVSREEAKQHNMIADQTVKGRRYDLLSRKKAMRKLDRVAPRIRKEANKICRAMFANINSNAKCDYQVKLEGGSQVNAWADGEMVYITNHMVSFTKNDTELAMILAHEYAHNILGHPASARQNAIAGGVIGLLVDIAAASQGVNTQGGFTDMATRAGRYAYSPEFEHEADYVSLYILSRAGYSTNRLKKLPDFWRRMSLLDENGVYASVSHPSNPARSVLVRKGVEEIKQKKRKREKLVPELRPTDSKTSNSHQTITKEPTSRSSSSGGYRRTASPNDPRGR